MILIRFIKLAHLKYGMAFAIADFHPGSENCKDLIIKSLSGNPALSAKKIHDKVKKDFQAKVSYQAVHKSLGLLVNANILKRYHHEYYLNQEWIEQIYSFVEDLKEKRAIQVKDASEPRPDYTERLKIRPIRFVPFLLGRKKSRVQLPPDCKVLGREKEKIFFSWRGNRYFWFGTGTCVQVIDEKEKQSGIIDFLLERRKKHHQLLNFESQAANDIKELIKTINPRAKPYLSYVMSIHAVEFAENIPYFENMLRLIAEPSFLGIPDNPKFVVGKSQIESAQRKLAGLESKEPQFPSVYEVVINRGKKTFASWSNVVFSSEKNEGEHHSQQLVKLETELQHLWFYFHDLKNEIRRKMKAGDKSRMKELLRKQRETAVLWSEFENLGAMDDTYTQLLKEGLIKTSRIEKIYAELQNLFSSCRLKIGNDDGL